MYALANLAKDNPTVALALAKHFPDKGAPAPVLSTVIQLAKSKPTEIKLAASLWCASLLPLASLPHSPPFFSATHIYRTSCPVPASMLSSDLYESYENTVMHIIARMLNVHANECTTHHRTKACYILHYFVHNDQSLSQEWGEDEAKVFLRPSRIHGHLDGLSLSLLSHEIRRCVADELGLLPFAKSSLRHKHYGPCQSIRALSRSVQALRTNLVDTGVGVAVMKIVMQGHLLSRERDKVGAETWVEEDRGCWGCRADGGIQLRE